MHVVELGAGIFHRNIAFEVDTNHQQKWVPAATDCPSPNVVAISSRRHLLLVKKVTVHILLRQQTSQNDEQAPHLSNSRHEYAK